MWPRISIVTSSFNQGRYIARTIESVQRQNYPNLEHIVVDGMSTDDTPEVLARYPHVQVIREPDRGQADAINKGFRRATGEIFAFLNSDDLLLPGALQRVAEEIDPRRGRHVVMGRCIFIDEKDLPTGLEHACLYAGHRRVLQAWKQHAIPQPSTFWTREVWDRCGPLDESEQHVLDYDLFCRFSRHYQFHALDEVLAAYRLHEHSKTCSVAQEATKAEALRVSRRYWGPWWRPMRWSLEASHAWHRLETNLGRRQSAADWLEESWRRSREGRVLGALGARALSWLIAPELVVGRWRRRVLQLVRESPDAPTREHWLAVRQAETLMFRSFTSLHTDDLAGPVLQRDVEISPEDRLLEFHAEEALPGFQPDSTFTFQLDGVPFAERRHVSRAPMRWTLPLPSANSGKQVLTVMCSDFVTVDETLGGSDCRPLSYRLVRLELKSAALAGGQAA